MDVNDEWSRRPVFRRAAAAVGALSIIPLAGCSTTEDDWSDPVDCDETMFEEEELRSKARATKYLLEQVETGFPEDILARGRDVGLSARSGVVVLQTLDNGLETGTATAWFVDDQFLFTNAHNVVDIGIDSVLGGATHDGDRFEVEVIGRVEGMQPDIALLRTDYRDATPLQFGQVEDLQEGQPLVQVGHPGEVGYWISSMGRFVTSSRVLSPEDDGTEYTELTTVVPGRRGVSGSPLLTLDGDVVGMTHSGTDIEARFPDDPPPVSPDIVFDGPIGGITMSLHDGSDILERKLEEWR